MAKKPKLAFRTEGGSLVPTDELLTLLCLYSLRAKRAGNWVNILHRGWVVFGCAPQVTLNTMIEEIIEWNRKTG